MEPIKLSCRRMIDCGEPPPQTTPHPYCDDCNDGKFICGPCGGSGCDDCNDEGEFDCDCAHPDSQPPASRVNERLTLQIQPFGHYTVPGLNPAHRVLVQALSTHSAPSGEYWRVQPVLAYQVLLPRAYYRPSEMVPAPR